MWTSGEIGVRDVSRPAAAGARSLLAASRMRGLDWAPSRTDLLLRGGIVSPFAVEPPKQSSPHAAAADYATWSDAELVAAIGRQDVQAFETLYDRHSGYVMGMVLRRLRDEEVADELVQDIFYQLWSGSTRFDAGKAKFTTWLFTVVRNRCIDVVRKHGRAPLVEALEEEPRDDKSLSPEARTEAGECRDLLAAALASLPEDQRVAVELCIVQGYSHSEAAERLGQPLGTLKSRVKIGLEKLKTKMSRARIAPGDGGKRGVH